MAKNEINWAALLKWIGLDFSETEELIPEIKWLKEQTEKNFEKFGCAGEHIGTNNVSKISD